MKYKQMGKYPKIKTLQVNEKLIILDGRSPLRYVDLRTDTVHIYTEYTEEPNSRDVLRIIGTAIEKGTYDWTSQRSIVIYPLLNEYIKNITVDFKVTES